MFNRFSNAHSRSYVPRHLIKVTGSRLVSFLQKTARVVGIPALERLHDRNVIQVLRLQSAVSESING